MKKNLNLFVNIAIAIALFTCIWLVDKIGATGRELTASVVIFLLAAVIYVQKLIYEHSVKE